MFNPRDLRLPPRYMGGHRFWEIFSTAQDRRSSLVCRRPACQYHVVLNCLTLQGGNDKLFVCLSLEDWSNRLASSVTRQYTLRNIPEERRNLHLTVDSSDKYVIGSSTQGQGGPIVAFPQQNLSALLYCQQTHVSQKHYKNLVFVWPCISLVQRCQ